MLSSRLTIIAFALLAIPSGEIGVDAVQYDAVMGGVDQAVGHHVRRSFQFKEMCFRVWPFWKLRENFLDACWLRSQHCTASAFNLRNGNKEAHLKSSFQD
ncbi:hypothetical protein DL96DRAFT_1603851 [Flagelloscypha sp. PMI_526]|nr:hypothetical protein DL96DRAFT_1603851 [Flagelloscypha sp. PMI_526]